jgi:hypothetical protein
MRRTTGLAGAAVALAATLTGAPAAVAAGGVYGGSTSRAEPIVITTDKAGKKLRGAVIAWESACADGKYFSDARSVAPAADSPGFVPEPRDLVMKRNGKHRFAGAQSAAFDLGDAVAIETVALAGKLRAKSASGTLNATVGILDKASGDPITTCSLRTRWSATRAPGRVYAGSTSQDEPVVTRINAKRTRVTDLLVSWDSASCQQPGSVHFGERLHNFSLAKSGRFGSTWNTSERASDGGSARTDYALTGRVAARRATGTLRIGVTWLDAAGSTTDACDSGGMTWKATTG